MRAHLWLLLIPALAFASPRKGKPPKAPAPPPPPVTAPMPKVSENVGDAVLARLQQAEAARSFRVDDSGGLRPDPARAIGSDFVRGVEGEALTGDALVTLKSVLFDEQSYRFTQDVGRCRFVPHASFQVQEGIETLEVLVSFSCNQVLFFSGKPGGRWLPRGTFDVKPARAKLLELVRVAFPKDGATQALR
jgi:hypothetical protein